MGGADTNGIAVTVLEFALEVAALLGETPSANWSAVAERIYMPITPVAAPGFMAGTLVHPEYPQHCTMTRHTRARAHTHSFLSQPTIDCTDHLPYDDVARMY